MHRPIAPGLIQGTLRGLLAGALDAAVLAGAGALFVSGVPSGLWIGVAIMIVVVATALGASDGLEARLGRRAALRALGALVGGGLAGAVIASALELVMIGSVAPTKEIATLALIGVLSAIPLGIVAVIVGPHERGAPPIARFRRACFAGALLATLPLLSLFVADHRSGAEQNQLLLAAAGCLVGGVVHATAHLIVRPIGRSVGSWLETEKSWSVRVGARDEYLKLAAEALALRRLAEQAPDEAARRSLHERGFSAARSAFDVAEGARLELVREEAGRQLRWFLRALGREEEARSLKV